MIRQFSMTRRRPNLVDLLIPRQNGVDGYRIQSAPNFTGAWTTRITAPVQGYVDPAINLALLEPQNLNPGPFGPPVRIVFNPATFSLTDTANFWLRFVPVSGGAAGTPAAPTLVLPADANKGTGIITIQGTAPNGADSTAALQIDLPGLCRDFRIRNHEGATILFVSTEQSGSELSIAAGATYESLLGAQGSLWVRGGGATAAFSATFTGSFLR